MSKSRIFYLVALLFPLAAFVIWSGLLYSGTLGNNNLTLKIRGYDPRDLLAGHYWIYQLDIENPCKIHTEYLEYCVGFSQDKDGAGNNKVLMIDSCSIVAGVTSQMIYATCRDGRLDTGLERYYIDEDVARLYPQLPANASIVVAIRNGKPTVRELLIDGMKLPLWLQRQQSN